MTDSTPATAADAIRECKRRGTDELLRRPGSARRIRSAEMAPVTFDGVPVSDLPSPPLNGGSEGGSNVPTH